MSSKIFLLILIIISNLPRNYEQNEELRRALTPLISGGDEASMYEYTFMAVVVKYELIEKTNKGRLICGGAIIHVDWVLTAARCFDDFAHIKKFEIHAGVVNLQNLTGQQTRLVKHIFMHPKYNKSSDEFNIALVQVLPSFVITAHVSAGHLPDKPLSISRVEGCYILGFVREHEIRNGEETYQERLMKVKLRAIDDKECLSRRKLHQIEDPHKLGERNYCLVQIEAPPHDNSQGACKGDVGGPCICGFKIQGIIAYETNVTCYKKGYPTTIVDAGHHLNWIRAVVLQLNIIDKGSAMYLGSSAKFALKMFCLFFLLSNVCT